MNLLTYVAIRKLCARSGGWTATHPTFIPCISWVGLPLFHRVAQTTEIDFLTILEVRVQDQGVKRVDF